MSSVVWNSVSLSLHGSEEYGQKAVQLPHSLHILSTCTISVRPSGRRTATLARFGQTSTQFWQTVSQLRQRSPSQQTLPGARRTPFRAIASASVGWASAGMS